MLGKTRTISVQPVFGEPALLLKSGKERALAIADLHLGLKYEWEREGVFIPDQKGRLTGKIREICETMRIQRLLVVGDFKHHLPGKPLQERLDDWERERDQWDGKLQAIFQKKRALEEKTAALPPASIRDRDSLLLQKLEREKMRQIGKVRERRNEIFDRLPGEVEAVNLVLEELGRFLDHVHIVKGNHDGGLERMVADSLEDRVTIHPAEGFRYQFEGTGNREGAKDSEDGTADPGREFGSVGFFHGHKWPSKEVASSELIVVGHTHYSFLFQDRLGAKVVEPVWVRGEPSPRMMERYPQVPRQFILMPSFNPLLNTKPINSRAPKLYGPMLKNRYLDINNARLYLFDGTKLGQVKTFVKFP